MNLATAEPVWGDTATAEIDRLGRALLELEYTLIPHGLHVVGEPPIRSSGRRCWTPPA